MNVAALVAAGSTDEAIADTLRIDRSTVWRWSTHSPTFQAELNWHHTAMNSAHADKLHDAMLAAGSMFMEEIKTQALHAGISIATIQRAKLALSIVPTKQAYAGGWQWELPHHDAQAEAEKNMDSPRYSREVELDHLAKNKGENAPNALQRAQDALVISHLNILDEKPEDAQVPWNDFDRFVEAMRAANWKWDDVKKWLGVPRKTSFIKVSDADRQKAYEMFRKK